MQRIEEIVDLLSIKVNSQQVMAKTLCLEFKSQEFEAKSRNISLPYYISHKDDLMKAFGDMLNAAWPLEPTRMLKVTLQNLRLRTMQDSKTAVMHQTLDLKEFFTKGPTATQLETVTEKEEGEEGETQGAPPKQATVLIASREDPEKLQAAIIAERKKMQDEKFKKLIGQRDINAFFGVPKTQATQSTQPV